MSRTLTRSLQLLQLLDGQASQKCLAYTTVRNDFGNLTNCQRASKCLRLSPGKSLRPISTTPPCRASPMGRAIKPNVKAQRAPSMAVQMKEQQRKALAGGELPEDIGLIPQTMVMPSISKRPGWLKARSDRWRIEKARIKTRIYELVSALAYRYIMVRPRPRLNYFKVATIAKELHSEVYAHFASGNLAPIEHKIVEGMKSSLRARLSQRAPNTSLRWTLHKYLGRPKLMSYKAILFPGPKGQNRSEKNGLIQAVVRIHSQQSLQHVKKYSVRDRNEITTLEAITDASGRELDEAAAKPNLKDTVEYVVIQKNLRKSKEGPWMMWGTTEELTMDRLKKDEEQSEKSVLGQLTG